MSDTTVETFENPVARFWHLLIQAEQSSALVDTMDPRTAREVELLNKAIQQSHAEASELIRYVVANHVQLLEELKSWPAQ